MIIISIVDVARAVGGLLVGDSNLYIKGISTDSRKIEPNNLFIPLVGENFDGHDFINDVIDKGVKCFLIEQDYDRPKNDRVTYVVVKDTLQALQDLASYYIKSINPYVIAITGSNGKTSSKDMLHAIMSKKYKTAKTSGNHNNEIGVPLSILEFDEDIKCAILEMGVEHYGDIDELCEIIKPNVSLITTIGTAHIANFNDSKKEIAKAKLEIYTNLKEGGYMFYNRESKEIEQVLKKMDKPNQLYSFGNGSELMIDDDIKYEDGYTKYKVSGFEEEFAIKTLGKHQVTNSLGCIGIGLKEGIDIKDIRSALKNLKFEKMRCDVINVKDSIIIDDSYKSNPESAKAAVDILNEFKDYKKIICFSDMLELGDQEKKYHKQVGSYIRKSKIADEVICTGPLAKYIAEKAHGKFFESKEECADYLKKYLDEKVVILIKGSRATQMDKVVEMLRK